MSTFITIHVKRSHGNQICKVCSKTFISIDDLISHMDENYKDKRFMNIPEKNPMIAGIVTKSFTQSQSAKILEKNHRIALNQAVTSVHEGKRPFKC